MHVAAVLLLCIVIYLVGCSSPSDLEPFHPSYDEIRDAGFYIYALPDKNVSNRNWTESIWILSFDRHCNAIYSGFEAYNPIHVNYRNEAQETVLAIQIGPWTAPWRSDEFVTPIALNTSIAKDNLAYGNTDASHPAIRFIDQYDVSVIVSARLSLAELSQIVSELEYIGPPALTTSPWNIANCAK